MKRLLQAGAFAAVAGTVTLTGCSPTDATQEPVSTTAPAAAGDNADNDERLETNARAQFQRNSMLRAYDIDVSAQNGRVTLRGTVPSDQAKQQAVSTVQQVNGVQSVDDQLTVAAAQPQQQQQPQQRTAAAGAQSTPDDSTGSPAWITTKIQAQYFINPEINPFNIDVTTSRDGIVTLRGRVENAADRDEAVRIARSTEGVRQVQDRLTLADAAGTTATATATTENQPDPWITAKIQAKYFLDDEVKGNDINVDTANGTVTLRGTVENERQRRQAVMLARNTEGVRNVTDQLSLAAGGNTAPTAKVDDTWITTKIQSQYFVNREIKGSSINVNTTGGVVTLEGAVNSAAQREAAEQIARDTDGVTRVENQLKVTTTNR